jgi:transcriptional regulator with XRE-family HTH domain
MIIYLMTGIDFPEWLQNELDRRSMSQADLARLSGLTTAGISRIMTGQRKAGPEACASIARALDLPPETVFRAAGLLPPKKEEPPTLGEWMFLYLNASEEEQERMLEMARVLSRPGRRRGEAPAAGEQQG